MLKELSLNLDIKKMRTFNLNFGPQHPAAHGVLRLLLEIDGEKSELQLGDAIIIPAGASQKISNIGDEDLEFFCLCTPRFLPECYEDLED